MTTLLDIVQDLLSASSGDTVNSIFDTVESEQIARIVKDCYAVVFPQLEAKETYTLFNLNSSGTSNKPTFMTVPSNVQRVEWLKYDSHLSGETLSNFRELEFLPLNEFIAYVQGLTDTSNTFVYTLTINGASVEVRCSNDKAPRYYTVFDKDSVLFDSYDASLENTLQSQKTLGYGKLSDQFQLVDTYVIPLDEAGVTLLTQEAKTQLWSELKQVDNALSAKKARQLKIIETKKAPYVRYKGYGRRSMK